MSNIRLFALAVLLLLPGLSFANQAASGFCTTGGIKVTTFGSLSSNPVQGSYLGCSVSVSIHGGGLATITDASGGALANPFTASSTNGFWQFAAANGFYDVTLSGGTPALPAPVTIVNLLLNDPNTASITQSSFTGSSFISSTALVAGSGIFRCASVDNCLVFRNIANGLDLALKKTGAAAGNLPADVLDASAFGGIKVSQFFSNSAQSAATGVLACSASDTCVSFRNQANSADIPGLAHDASDRIVIGGAAGFTASIGNITNGLTIGTTLTVGGASSLQGVTATTITASGEIAPSITGGALGDTAHRFDAFIRNLDVISLIIGSMTVSGNVSVGGTLGAKTINKVRYVDSVNSQGWAGSDPGAWINAAAADAGAFGTVVLAPVVGGTYPAITTALVLPRGLTLKLPPGVFQIVGGTSISAIGVTILGAGRQSTYLEPTSATGNIFTIATGGTNFEIGNLSILAAVPRTSGAIFSINDGQCLFHDLFIQDMFDGFVQNAGSTGNTFKDIIVVSAGGNWHNVFKNAPLASGTIPGTTIDNMLIVLAGATVTGDAVVLDSGTDSTKINGLEISKLTGVDSNVGFRVQSTGAAQIPSYIEVTNSYVEVNATSVAVQIDNAQIPVFSNVGVAVGLMGLKITGGKGIRFVNSFFNSTQQGAIQITGGSDMTITGNAIADCARAGANTFDAIAISAGVTGFNISGNRIGTFLFASQTYKNGISVAAGASNNYVIAGNTISDFGTGDISDLGTGANKTVSRTGQSNLLNAQGPASAIVGTGADAIVFTFPIQANTIGAGKGIRVDFGSVHSTGAAAVIYKIILGTTTIASWSDAATGTNLGYTNINNVAGVQNSQYATTFAQDAGTITQGNNLTAAENTANALVIKLTMSVAATDQVTPKFWKVTLDQ